MEETNSSKITSVAARNSMREENSRLDHPFVSVITVVLNGERFLEKAILSVLGQTYSNIEFLVLDGASTDGTLDIIRRYDDQIDHWISEKDEGIYDAMNKGIRLSKGEIIGILNADDWYEPDTVQAVIAAFSEDLGLDLVYGAMRIWDPTEAFFKLEKSREGDSDLLHAPFNHPTCFVRRSAYERIGAFDQSFATAADYDWMLRFKRKELRYRYLPRVLTNFRKGGTTTRSLGVPGDQIWRLLRKNGCGRIQSSGAIVYRSVRLAALLVINFVGLRGVKDKFRGHRKTVSP